MDVTVLAEGGGVVNSRVRDAFERPDTVRVSCLAESNFHIRVADINYKSSSDILLKVESKVSTGVGVVFFRTKFPTERDSEEEGCVRQTQRKFE